MTGSSVYENAAVVGGRIRRARRELGLTQAELATRIGISLGVLDRFETGKADASGKLAEIAEVTGRPVSWYTSTDEYDIGGGELETGLPAELRRRLAGSRSRRVSADAEHAEEQTAAGHDGRGSRPPADSSFLADAQPDLAAPSEDLLDERKVLVQRQAELQATLAAEQQEHAARVAQMAEELERVNANQRALAGLLEQLRSELAASRAQEVGLVHRVSQLETELLLAEERAAEVTARLDEAGTELELLRNGERARAAELDLRHAELGVRSAELETREAAVNEAKEDVGFRSTQLDAREAELGFQSAQLDAREAELGAQSAQLDTREAAIADAEAVIEDRRRALDDIELRAEAVERREDVARLREEELEHREAVLDLTRRLDELKGTTEIVEGRGPLREDAHLAVAPDHGYKLVARPGAVPDPGAIVELDEVRYRCLRIQASPFLGDDRQCAVLELLPPEPEPEPQREPELERSTEPPVE